MAGRKAGIVAVVEVDFRADVGYVPSPRPLALVAADDRIGSEVARQVGGEGRGAEGLVVGIGGVESEVGIDVAEGHAHRVFLREFAGVPEVKRHLVGIDALQLLAAHAAGGNLAEREVAQRSAHCLVVLTADLPVSGQVGQEYVVDYLAQPRGIAERHSAEL